MSQELDGGQRVGWQSILYGRKDPTPTFRLASRSVLPVRFLTLLSLGSTPTITQCDPLARVVWHEQTGIEGTVELFPPDRQADIIRSVRTSDGAAWTVPCPLAGSSCAE